MSSVSIACGVRLTPTHSTRVCYPKAIHIDLWAGGAGGTLGRASLQIENIHVSRSVATARALDMPIMLEVTSTSISGAVMTCSCSRHRDQSDKHMWRPLARGTSVHLAIGDVLRFAKDCVFIVECALGSCVSGSGDHLPALASPTVSSTDAHQQRLRASRYFSAAGDAHLVAATRTIGSALQHNAIAMVVAPDPRTLPDEALEKLRLPVLEEPALAALGFAAPGSECASTTVASASLLSRFCEGVRSAKKQSPQQPVQPVRSSTFVSPKLQLIR